MDLRLTVFSNNSGTDQGWSSRGHCPRGPGDSPSYCGQRWYSDIPLEPDSLSGACVEATAPDPGLPPAGQGPTVGSPTWPGCQVLKVEPNVTNPVPASVVKGF